MRDDSVDIDALLAECDIGADTWRQHAACQGMPTGDFFAEIPGANIERACARCPVRLACIADEVGRPLDEVCGFRGGMPETQRRQLLANVARRRPAGRDAEHVRARRAFDAGATAADVASQFGVSVRTAYRWRSDAQRRAG